MRIARNISAVDTHVCGEPGRVIVGGVLDVPGNTIFEKKCYLEEHGDHLRKMMLREPRGYPASNCNLILPACHPKADAGFVIMEQVEYPPMSGTNTIAVATVLLETGMIPAVEPVTELTLESPAGLIGIRAEIQDNKVKSVTFDKRKTLLCAFHEVFLLSRYFPFKFLLATMRNYDKFKLALCKYSFYSRNSLVHSIFPVFLTYQSSPPQISPTVNPSGKGSSGSSM